MEREHRYYVAKTKDVEKYLSDEQQLSLDRFLTKIRIGRLNDGKADVQTVCVDSDWPEYETVWKMLEARVNGKASPASAPEDVIDAVTIALRKAFQLGQTYWQQADSDYISQNKKSDDTYAKFLVLSEEISALLAAAPTPTSTEDRKDAELWRDLVSHQKFNNVPAVGYAINQTKKRQAMQEDKP